MLNKVESNSEIISSHTKEQARKGDSPLLKLLEKIADNTNQLLICTYFAILIFLNNQAFTHLENGPKEFIPLYFALVVIQFGLGFMLIATTLKRDGSNR